MTTYIVDASVVIERLIKGPYTSNARALFNRLNPTDRLVVPVITIDRPQERAAIAVNAELKSITDF